jgi:membrane-bound metal-dependent hydrolase YbcI (DUF457 family)
MMGRSHVLGASLVWLVGAPIVADLVGYRLTPGELLASTAVVSYGALRPDIDSPDSTIAYAGGPPTRWLARGVRKVVRHRGAVHSLLFGVAAGAAKWLSTSGLAAVPFTFTFEGRLITIASVGRLVALATMTVSIALTMRALGLAAPSSRGSARGWPALYSFAAVLTWSATVLVPGTWPWMPLAIGLGCCLHSLCDALTPEGALLLYPSRRRYAWVAIEETGDRSERYLVQYGIGALDALLLWRAFMPDLHGRLATARLLLIVLLIVVEVIGWTYCYRRCARFRQPAPASSTS